MVLVRVDIYVRRVHNLPISPYLWGEVSSPNGLGNPTPKGIDPTLGQVNEYWLNVQMSTEPRRLFSCCAGGKGGRMEGSVAFEQKNSVLLSRPHKQKRVAKMAHFSVN